jgi:type VI secretion system protein ImpK
MSPIPDQESFLLVQFREFYSEVIRLKRLIRTNVWASPSGNGSGAHSENGETPGTWIFFPEVAATVSVAPVEKSLSGLSVVGSDPGKWTREDPANSLPADYRRMSVMVWQRLLALFKRQAADAWRYGGAYAAEFHLEAQYVMVAFADEVFIHMDWEGKRDWMSNLLETELFQSHIAGELFFDRLDTLLKTRDPVYKSVAAIYLMALSLGFRGRYYGVDDRGRIQRYRQELFAFIYRRETDLSYESKHFFPDAYVQNLKKEKRLKLHNPRLWLSVLGIVLVSYLAISHGLWMHLTSRLKQVNSQIIQIEKQLDRSAPAASN